MPVVVPKLPRISVLSWRFKFGGCLAAEERLRRWPAAAEKDEVGEARAAVGRRWLVRTTVDGARRGITSTLLSPLSELADT